MSWEFPVGIITGYAIYIASIIGWEKYKDWRNWRRWKRDLAKRGAGGA